MLKCNYCEGLLDVARAEKMWMSAIQFWLWPPPPLGPFWRCSWVSGSLVVYVKRPVLDLTGWCLVKSTESDC